MNKRVNFVNKIQKLLRETNCDDVCLKYGYIDYEKVDRYGRNGVFVESTEDVNTDPAKREVVLVKYYAQLDEFGTIQSIEGDGLFLILKDIIKAVDRL